MIYKSKISNSQLSIILMVLNLLFLIQPSFSQRPIIREELKPRIIVLTDLKRVQETDDAQSLIRLLTLADLVEIEGIIISSGFNYWKPEHIQEGYELVWEYMDAYHQSVKNLMKMNEQKSFNTTEEKQQIGYWPSADYLRQRVALGTSMVTMSNVGNGKDNAGSRLITSVVDENDERQVWVLVWGGGNVLGQALWDISVNPLKKRTEQGIKAFTDKIRVVAIGEQDGSWSQRSKPDTIINSHYWMRKQFPDLFWATVSGRIFSQKSNELQPFYQLHIQGHGALGNCYPDHSNSTEGDTPSLFYVLPLGFGNPERPDWGSFAGMLKKGPFTIEKGTSVWRAPSMDSAGISEKNYEIVDNSTQNFWNMFAARLDWVRSGTGNRPPVAVVNGDETLEILQINAKSGQEIRLDASGSFDHESDKLDFRWYVLPVENGFSGEVVLKEANQNLLTFQVPSNAKGKDIHIILEVTDDGAAHHLTSYRRVIIRAQ